MQISCILICTCHDYKFTNLLTFKILVTPRYCIIDNAAGRSLCCSPLSIWTTGFMEGELLVLHRINYLKLDCSVKFLSKTVHLLYIPMRVPIISHLSYQIGNYFIQLMRWVWNDSSLFWNGMLWTTGETCLTALPDSSSVNCLSLSFAHTAMDFLIDF